MCLSAYKMKLIYLPFFVRVKSFRIRCLLGYFFIFGLSMLYVFPLITGAPNDRMFPDTFDVSGGLVYALKTRKTFYLFGYLWELANSFECDETTVSR